ncbi:thiol-disulfide oxidoreductase DCC family protein [Thalassotalea litorea]|uniref:Thiol-disulfide oxidoreductase DCC family protein n=1 Tax=Thalassotalea litorea TaxID=2020715 RepID=A0A5R9IEQ1_9GAMM|nr:thiol-disulfide oxidoreductase DCC family protein [Thalassotalea litorea]
MSSHNIVIFDGICNFCNGAVNFIIERDIHDKYRFASMQSEAGQALIEQYQVNDVGVDTFLLIKSGKCYFRTDAALEITKDLKGFWQLIRTTLILPPQFRDFFYKCFARNRYKLFGRREQCIIPTPEIRNKFLK